MLPGGEEVEEAEEAPQADNTAERHGHGMNATQVRCSVFPMGLQSYHGRQYTAVDEIRTLAQHFQKQKRLSGIMIE